MAVPSRARFIIDDKVVNVVCIGIATIGARTCIFILIIREAGASEDVVDLAVRSTCSFGDVESDVLERIRTRSTGDIGPSCERSLVIGPGKSVFCGMPADGVDQSSARLDLMA